MTTRWFVEVSPVEASSLKERYCVEALQWQQALQQARKIRGDRGPVARFAMELLEAGYRATDPATRLRYTVSKAPVGAPLSVRPAAINGGIANGNGKPHRLQSDPEIEELSNPMLVALPPPLETNYEEALPTLPRASEKPAKPEAVYESRPAESVRSGSARPSQIPLPGRKTRSRGIQTSPAVPRPNRSHPPSEYGATAVDGGVHASGSAAPNLSAVPQEEPVPTLPGLTLLSHRTEEPTEAVPILYREYAMAFDANLSPRELERYARAIWEQVRTNLAHRPSGKFVQVALFDHRFTGKPERAPAAVLAWKDWRGEPVIRIRTAKAPVSAVPPEDETAKAVPVAARTDAVDSGWPLAPISSLPASFPPRPQPAQQAAAPEPALIEAEPREPSGPLASPAPVPTEAAVPDPSPVLVEAEPIETSVPAPAAAAPVLELVPEVENSDIAAAAALAAPPLAADESAAPPAAVAAPGSFPAPSPSAIPVLPPPVPPPLEPKDAPAAVVIAPVAPEPAALERVAPEPAAPEPAAPEPAAPEPAAPEPVAQVTPAPRVQQPSQPKLGRAPAPRSSGNAVRRRGSSEDLIGELFEEMHQLHFMPDIVAGADYVLSCVLFMLPCEGVLIHVFDINAREFVVVRAAGPSFRDALLTKTPDTYPLFREAFRRAATQNFPTVEGDERFTAERFQRLGVAVKSAMCGAVQHGGRYLGIIELLNPLGGEPFRVTEVNALDYICEQFADFVASRPIVLDEDAVLPKA